MTCASVKDHGFLVAGCNSIGKTGLETNEARSSGYLGGDDMLRLIDNYGRA